VLAGEGCGAEHGARDGRGDPAGMAARGLGGGDGYAGMGGSVEAGRLDARLRGWWRWDELVESVAGREEARWRR
jgi:hypothetical protein